MKKILIIILLILITSAAFAADARSIAFDLMGVKDPKKSAAASMFGEYKRMDEAGTSLKGLSMKLETMDIASMDKNERIETYNSLKQKALVPTLLNLGVGFGIGSNMVGDGFGFSIALIGDISAFALLGVAGGIWLTDFIIAKTVTLGQANSPASPELMEIAKYTAIAGGIVLAASHVIQAIFPPIHVARYNAKLRESLGLTKAEIKAALVPNENLGITAVAAIQF